MTRWARGNSRPYPESDGPTFKTVLLTRNEPRRANTLAIIWLPSPVPISKLWAHNVAGQPLARAGEVIE